MEFCADHARRREAGPGSVRAYTYDFLHVISYVLSSKVVRIKNAFRGQAAALQGEDALRQRVQGAVSFAESDERWPKPFEPSVLVSITIAEPCVLLTRSQRQHIASSCCSFPLTRTIANDL